MKLNEVEFKKEVAKLYDGEIKIVSKYKGLSYPILVEDKYGILSIPKARAVLKNRPTIKSALNKTEYFMGMLRVEHPEIAELITPASEYEAMKKKMLFNTKYGLVSVNPDNLVHGHIPTIRVAVNRKEYFKNQLLFLYDNKYDFEIDSTDRHEGRVTLICPIHGKQSVDSDSIFLGTGCPCCNKFWEKSNTFYLIRLYDEKESFYKLGISYINDKGEVRRFREYKALGYNIDIIQIHTFEDALQCKEFELKLKKIIRPSLYKPNRWEYESSTETFTNDLLPIILENIKYDIVSTSGESQSSSLENASELTTQMEDNTI